MGCIRSGNFGHVAAFSTQTYKHMNSGEGGLLTTNDPLIAAKAIIMSGSYMLYERHGARPDAEVFLSIRTHMPNFSCRLDHLRAALITAQMAVLDDNIDAGTVSIKGLIAICVILRGQFAVKSTRGILCGKLYPVPH